MFRMCQEDRRKITGGKIMWYLILRGKATGKTILKEMAKQEYLYMEYGVLLEVNKIDKYQEN